MSIADRFRTHDVENQPPALAPYDMYTTDVPLREALARHPDAARVFAPRGAPSPRPA